MNVHPSEMKAIRSFGEQSEYANPELGAGGKLRFRNPLLTEGAGVDLRTPEGIAASEQAAKDTRFNDVRDRFRAKAEGMRAAEEAAASRAKKIGLGLGALGVAGAGAYAVHKHLQEKQAETYSMPLKDAIKEHKDLTAVLRSNNRKEELKELKEQGEELKGMMNRE